MNTRQATPAMIVAVIMVFGLVPSYSIASESPTAAIFELPFTALGPCGDCFQICSGRREHVFFQGEGPDRSFGEDQATCQTGWCSRAHRESPGVCGSGDAGDVNGRVWNLLASLEATEDLREALDEFGDTVRYNATRQAVQVQGCDGSTILSIPLTAEQVEVLSE